MSSKLVDNVTKEIQNAFYQSEDSSFGKKEAIASIQAIINWLKVHEDEDDLSFLFPAIEVLEKELKDL
jgi:hypothetical protein